MTDPPCVERVVADADVLAADLLVGGAAREALDVVRSHSWIELVASDPLLDDCEAVVAGLADADLAGEHRERLEARRLRVEQPADDHPGLASAYRGNAAHLLSFDPRLRSARAGASLRARMDVSVKHPRSFGSLFDPEAVWPSVGEGPYPGPDRDPRE